MDTKQTKLGHITAPAAAAVVMCFAALFYLVATYIGPGHTGVLAGMLGIVAGAIAAEFKFGSRKIPFGEYIGPPEPPKPGSLLQMLAALAFVTIAKTVLKQVREQLSLPAERIANTANNNYSIQPPEPVRGGIHACLTPRLSQSPATNSAHA